MVQNGFKVNFLNYKDVQYSRKNLPFNRCHPKVKKHGTVIKDYNSLGTQNKLWAQRNQQQYPQPVLLQHNPTLTCCCHRTMVNQARLKTCSNSLQPIVVSGGKEPRLTCPPPTDK
jgi:hypothetical protein